MHWLGIRTLPIPALVAADPALIFSYRYWHNLKEGGWLPPRCRIDTPHYRLIVPDAHWIRVIDLEASLELGPLQGLADTEAAVEVGGERLGERLQALLRPPAVTGTPLFQLIELRCRTEPLAYQQLVLPVADDGCHPTELLHLCRRGSLALQTGLTRDAT